MSNQYGRVHAAFFIVAFVAIGLGIAAQFFKPFQEQQPEFEKLILLPVAREIKETVFTDHRGDEFDSKHWLGKWTVLFFGFTNCPDICPTTMQTLANTKKQLIAQERWPTNLQIAMVSVDPQRDTQEKLAAYVPWFDQEFIGLRANVEATERFAKELGILFFKRNGESETRYEVDHGSSLILINPDGQYAGVLTAPHDSSTLSHDLALLGNLSVANQGKVMNRVSPEPGKEKLPSLVITDAWVRSAPPSTRTLAGYFKVQNNTESAITLVEAKSYDFEEIMIHETSTSGELVSMNHLDEVKIDVGQVVEFQPMGKHLMLVQPLRSLTNADIVSISLIDDQGRKYDQEFVISPNL